jgi:3-isopropylmalate dehydrogenase
MPGAIRSKPGAALAPPQSLGYKLGVLRGDGIGPEIVESTLQVAESAIKAYGSIDIEWIPLPIGWDAIRTAGVATPEETKLRLAECDAFILGPIDHVAYPPSEHGRRNPSGELRHHFDLYANIRPAHNYPGVAAVAKDTDLVIVRENSEGFYSDRNMYQGSGEFMPTADVALSVGVFTRRAAIRLAHAAYRLAARRRRHLTIVHKANVLLATTGLYLDVIKDLGRDYPSVTVDDYHVDAMAAHLVRRPSAFDVIVTENLFGDILSDLTGELVGSLGAAPSINVGDGRAMAQAAHGSAPDIAGKNIANPIGEIASTAMLFRWLGDQRGNDDLIAAAVSIELALDDVLRSGVRPRDMGGTADTTAFTEALVQAIQTQPRASDAAAQPSR